MKLAIAASGSLQNPAFRGGQLCFTRFRNRYNGGHSDIGIFDLKSRVTRILMLRGEANVSQPGSCWNERGLIFSSDGYGGSDRACFWDGASVHVLYRPKDMTWEPSWGPDFYVAERHRSGDDPGQIIMAPLATLNKITELTDVHRDCRQPCVSADGHRILFQEQTEDDWQVVLLDLDTGAETDLAAGTDATFCHDGKRIVFSDNDGRLRVMELDTRKLSSVRVETPYSGAPSFSPDDRQIAYEGGPGGDDGGPPTSIYLTDAPC